MDSLTVMRWLKRLAIPAGIVLVVILLRATVFRPDPVSVSVYAVDRGRVEETVVNSRAGTVESRLRAKMSPAIAGLVNAIPVKKGGWVKRGQVLLRLDDREYAAQVALAARSLDAAAAAVDQSCLTAEQAERDLARVEGLAQKGLVSEKELDGARTLDKISRSACAAARQRVKEAEAALDAARAILAKTVMIAPFDGVVLDVTTEVGEWISPAPPGVFIPPVVDLIDPDSLYVSAPLDEADVAKIRQGLPVRLTMDSFRGQEFSGTVTYVASYVETKQEQNRTLTVEAEFSQAELPENLLPGISADVEVILDVHENVVRIPTYALLEGNRTLLAKGDRLVEQKVTPGLRNWQYTEITEGLAEGDLVVVSLDRPEVKAGARAKVASPSS
jgi:HlyD family secretion protein